MSVLVTGFGAFPGVPENPTEQLARSLDGAVIAGRRVIGRVLPVSFARGPALAVALAREHAAELVVGLGVAVGRRAVCVERRGVRVAESSADVDGACRPGLDGPAEIRATLNVDRLAHALSAELSDDAGTYVCNAWLYAVAQSLDVPVGFVHVPPSGLSRDRLLAGIQALLAS